MNRQTKTLLILFAALVLAVSIYLSIEPKGSLVIFFNERHNSVLDTFFMYVTYLGDGILFAPIIIAFLFVRYSHAISFAVLGLVQLLLVQGLKKKVFGRMPRPAEYFKDSYELQPIEGVDIHHFYSFPSGHAATAFGIVTMLLLLLRPGLTGSLLLFILAVLAGVSRVYLGQHFLGDILAGSLLGTLSAVFVYTLFDQIQKKNPNSVLYSSSLLEKIRKE